MDYSHSTAHNIEHNHSACSTAGKKQQLSRSAKLSIEIRHRNPLLKVFTTRSKKGNRQFAFFAFKLKMCCNVVISHGDYVR